MLAVKFPQLRWAFCLCTCPCPTVNQSEPWVCFNRHQNWCRRAEFLFPWYSSAVNMLHGNIKSVICQWLSTSLIVFAEDRVFCEQSHLRSEPCCQTLAVSGAWDRVEHLNLPWLLVGLMNPCTVSCLCRHIVSRYKAAVIAAQRKLWACAFVWFRVCLFYPKWQNTTLGSKAE